MLTFKYNPYKSELSSKRILTNLTKNLNLIFVGWRRGGGGGAGAGALKPKQYARLSNEVNIK